MDNPDVVVADDADWNKFPTDRKELKGPPELIVDPMVFRTADVYLRGRKAAQQLLPDKEPAEVWSALSANVGSLVAFFDALILSEQLPIIDYGYTFDSQIGFEQHELYHRCNQAAAEQVLVSVHVMMSAYQQAKAAALEALRERPPIPDELAASVLQEMSAFDYGWRPDLSALEPLPEDENQLVLLRFLFGGLLFGAYAQVTGAGHLIQPKRSRLYLAAALAAPSASYAHERELFDELNMIVRQTEGMQEGLSQVDALPSFLPYLLSKDPQSPDDLLRSALALRKNSAVKDYRAWRKQLVEDWRDKGKIDRSNERAIRQITQAMLQKLETPDDATPNLSLNAGLTGVGLDVGVPIPVGRLWGWVLGHLPGRRYTKLLMRMQLAAHEYRRLDRHLSTLWSRT
jgi:hypothetical protein